MIEIVLSTILWAVLRAWYGGQFKYNNRGVQTVVMLLATFLPLYTILPPVWALISSLWIQFQFWSRGHGPVIDDGHDKNPTQSTIERYCDRWFDKVCKYFYPEEDWYTTQYDRLWMLLRYTCPMYPMAFVSPLFILCGVVSPFAYKYSWDTTNTWRRAEWIMGGVFGFVLALVRVLYAG